MSNIKTWSTHIITRITNGGTDNSDGIFLLTGDVHYQSTNRGTLNRAPDFYNRN